MRPSARIEPRRLARAALLLIAAAALSGQSPRTDVTRVGYDALPGWDEGKQAEALPAILRSCGALGAAADDAPLGGLAYAGPIRAWREACAALEAVGPGDAAARAVIEAHFVPHAIAGEGLFTGYFEPTLHGAARRDSRYAVPIHGRPDDLVVIRLAGYAPDPSPLRFVGRRVGERVERYPPREAILAGEAGAPPVLAWVDDPVDAFFLHIQGSGVIEMADGATLRVGYAANNGHPFVNIAAIMIERGWIERETVSLQTMAAWMRAHPEEAEALMNRYPRYIFFQSRESGGPIGTQGVPLTPGRSLAVDTEFVPLGAPLWLDTTDPLTGERLRRLVVAQDTGGAIKGAVRGDVFWGAGDIALERAGRMKERGRYTVLLPRAAAGGDQ